MQKFGDLLILHREKIVSTYYGHTDGCSLSDRGSCGLSRPTVQEEKETRHDTAGTSQAVISEAGAKGGESARIYSGRQRHHIYRPDTRIEGIFTHPEDEGKGVEEILSSGAQFQQDLPLRISGTQACSPGRQHDSSRQPEEGQTRKIHQQRAG